MIKITETELAAFKADLENQEKRQATIQKYMRDVRRLSLYLGGAINEKKNLIGFKEALLAEELAPTSINSMLAAVNRFLEFTGVPQWKLRFLKVQRTTFREQSREMNLEDYESLIRAAVKKGNERLTMLLQTLCATGIRVSELRAITVESLSTGRASIHSKNKVRLILLPGELCRRLEQYCEKHEIASGRIFITKSGASMDRSNIWKMIKKLCAAAHVAETKAFPHNFRHLFAKTFYEKYKDIVRLADILGHSSVDTTRRYTIKDGTEQQRQIAGLGLLTVSQEFIPEGRG